MESKVCRWHLCKEELTGRRYKFCSSKCSVKFHVSKLRRELKRRAVEYKGGCCKDCGYSKSLAALHFHHLENKEFGISQKGKTRTWEAIKPELDKCILLCANCHAERHAEPYQG